MRVSRRRTALLCIWLNAWPKVLSGLAWTRLRSVTAQFRGGFLDPIVPFALIAGSRLVVLVGLVAILLVGLSTVLAGCRGSVYFSLGHQPKIRNCFLNYGVANWAVNYLTLSESFRSIPGTKSRLLTRFPSWPA